MVHDLIFLSSDSVFPVCDFFLYFSWLSNSLEISLFGSFKQTKKRTKNRHNNIEQNA